MDQLSYRTEFILTPNEKKEWFLIDATNQTLGRLCTKVASILMGKHKPTFTPNLDAGDCVIIINSDKISLTGNKWNDKEYIRHTGHPGGQRLIKAKDLNVKKPIALIETGVKGMLPKSKLGNAMFKKLHVYQGAEHKHSAQMPKTITIK
ncbi:MAG: 50S ribosomal protein L13 [Bacteroidetes bacterium]|nr:50S ribosomal protein L13 [Bacteroidota bacterium]